MLVTRSGVLILTLVAVAPGLTSCVRYLGLAGPEDGAIDGDGKSSAVDATSGTGDSRVDGHATDTGGFTADSAAGAEDAGDTGDIPGGGLSCWDTRAKALSPYLWLTLDEGALSDPVRNAVTGEAIGSHSPDNGLQRTAGINTGHAVHFPGTTTLGSGIYIPNVPQPQASFPLGELTIGVWVRRTTNVDNRVIFSYSSSQEQNDFVLSYEGSRVVGAWLRGTGYESSVPLSRGTWQYVTVTWNSSTGDLQFFLDGQLRDTLRNTKRGQQLGTGGSIYIGQDQDAVREPSSLQLAEAFQGELDELMLWPRVLSPAEILSLYTSGQAVVCP